MSLPELRRRRAAWALLALLALVPLGIAGWGTHLDLGPCAYLVATGHRCPGCGMTTAFRDLMHGQPFQALRANALGVLLFLSNVALVPAAVVACVRAVPAMGALRFLWRTHALELLCVAFVAWLAVWAAGARAPACPAPFAADAARAGALVVRLGTIAEGATTLSGPLPAICFGPAGPSSITTDGVVLMDGALDEGEAAARLGHLLRHAADGLPMAHPTPGDCDAQVEKALEAEARALALELRLRRELGVGAPRLRYEFESDFWAAPAEQREADVLAYLHRHPDGAPGLDALASGYARRCREAR